MFPKSNIRILQQQPPRHSDPQQQQAGSSDFQPKPKSGKQQQMGEVSDEGSADDKKSVTARPPVPSDRAGKCEDAAQR